LPADLFDQPAKQNKRPEAYCLRATLGRKKGFYVSGKLARQGMFKKAFQLGRRE
jgi:hypothetical protein